MALTLKVTSDVDKGMSGQIIEETTDKVLCSVTVQECLEFLAMHKEYQVMEFELKLKAQLISDYVNALATTYKVFATEEETNG